MRITSRSSNGTWKVTAKQPNPAYDWETSTSEQQSYFNLSRNDIVSNPFGVGGWREPSPYTVFQNSLINKNGYFKWIREGPSWLGSPTSSLTWDGTVPIPVPWNLGFIPPSPLDSRELINKALLDLQDQRVNVGVAVAQLSQSVDGIAERLRKLAEAYRHGRKGNWNAVARTLGVKRTRRGKKQASDWLEFQYGWMPILVDIEGLYDEVRRDTRLQYWRLRGMARSYKEERLQGPSGDPIWDGCKLYQDVTYEYRARVSLHYEVHNPLLLVAAATGLTSASQIAWELIPFSFVVDWLLPVGDMLSALSADEGLTFLGGTSTMTVRAKWRSDISAGEPFTDLQGWTVTPLGSGQSRYEAFQMIRTVFKTAPSAQLPRFKNPFTSVKRGLNAIALLRAVFK